MVLHHGCTLFFKAFYFIKTNPPLPYTQLQTVEEKRKSLYCHQQMRKKVGLFLNMPALALHISPNQSVHKEF